jgi:GNAT superfamily N-acetyltransferase
VNVRPAAPSDRDEVLRLAAALATSFTPTEDALGEAFDALLGDDGALVLVGETSGGGGYLLAFVHHTFFAGGPVVWIEELMVDESARRSGLGRALVEAAETWATARGARLVALATRRADAFWTAVGYEPSATYLRKLLP